jgi:hypothetical protein
MPGYLSPGPRVTDAQIEAAMRDLAAMFDDSDWHPGDTITIAKTDLEAALREKGHSLACVRHVCELLLAQRVFTRVEHYEKGTTLSWGNWEHEVTPGETIPAFRVAYDAWYRSLVKSQRTPESDNISLPTTEAVTQKRTCNRKKRVAELLLALLEGDRTNMSKSQTELAAILQCHPSSISRAFADEDYGPRLRSLYQEHALEPPTADQI